MPLCGRSDHRSELSASNTEPSRATTLESPPGACSLSLFLACEFCVSPTVGDGPLFSLRRSVLISIRRGARARAVKKDSTIQNRIYTAIQVVYARFLKGSLPDGGPIRYEFSKLNEADNSTLGGGVT